jgi:hypothetical protein
MSHAQLTALWYLFTNWQPLYCVLASKWQSWYYKLTSVWVRHIAQLSRKIFLYTGAAKQTTTASSLIRADWVHDQVATDYCTLQTHLSNKGRERERKKEWLAATPPKCVCPGHRPASQPGHTIKPGVSSRQCLPFTITRTMATVSKEGTTFAKIKVTRLNPPALQPIS